MSSGKDVYVVFFMTRDDEALSNFFFCASSSSFDKDFFPVQVLLEKSLNVQKGTHSFEFLAHTSLHNSFLYVPPLLCAIRIIPIVSEEHEKSFAKDGKYMSVCMRINEKSFYA